MINLQHQGQPNGYFGGSHRQNEQKHDLPVRLMPAGARCDKCQPRCVQHDLQRHQDEDQITAYEQAGQPQREQDPR